MMATRNLSFTFSDSHVSHNRLMMNRAYAGMVKRLVSKVPNPAALRFRVRYWILF